MWFWTVKNHHGGGQENIYRALFIPYGVNGGYGTHFRVIVRTREAHHLQGWILSKYLHLCIECTIVANMCGSITGCCGWSDLNAASSFWRELILFLDRHGLLKSIEKRCEAQWIQLRLWQKLRYLARGLQKALFRCKNHCNRVFTLHHVMSHHCLHATTTGHRSCLAMIGSLCASYWMAWTCVNWFQTFVLLHVWRFLNVQEETIFCKRSISGDTIHCRLHPTR